MSSSSRFSWENETRLKKNFLKVERWLQRTFFIHIKMCTQLMRGFSTEKNERACLDIFFERDALITILLLLLKGHIINTKVIMSTLLKFFGRTWLSPFYFSRVSSESSPLFFVDALSSRNSNSFVSPSLITSLSEMTILCQNNRESFCLKKCSTMTTSSMVIWWVTTIFFFVMRVHF